MDTSTVLEKYTQDLSNLPLEVKHLLEEMRSKDTQLMEARKRYQTKDNQIHKFIRANGTLTKHPKEQQLYHKIEEDMRKVQRLQQEKVLLANTALFLISKHLFNFETDITKLERDELLPPIESVWEEDGGSALVRNDLNSALGGISDALSGTVTPRNGTMGSNSDLMKRVPKRKQGLGLRTAGAGAGSLTRPTKRMKSEEADDRSSSRTPGPDLAGSFSFGTADLGAPLGMVHIDGPSNNGEDADNSLYCLCQRVSFGEMIGCDNDDCKYEWFHWSCVGITSPPKDDEIWYCPDCAPKMEKRKKKKKT